MSVRHEWPPPRMQLCGGGAAAASLRSHTTSSGTNCCFKKKKKRRLSLQEPVKQNVAPFSSSLAPPPPPGHPPIKNRRLSVWMTDPGNGFYGRRVGSIHQAGPTLTSCLKVCSAAVYGEIKMKKKKKHCLRRRFPNLALQQTAVTR